VVQLRKMVFNKLYIFSSSEKKAKVVEFAAGKNIITSSPIDGTDRGKSIIMKSLYHALGADCFFDDKWKDEDKTYIVNFSIEKEEYYIFRCNRLFKVFDSKRRLLFKTIDRHELAVSLDSIFHFAVKLPNRSEDKLEVTPPVYNYLLYFIDQDKLDGSNFASFGRLAQYPNFKENTLFYHFGAFDDNYYETIRKLESLRDEITCLQKEKELSESMLEKVSISIMDVSYSKSIDLLRHDIERSKQQYSSIAQALSGIRAKLIELRNEKDELYRSLQLLEHLGKLNEKHISSLLKHKCPLCNSEVPDAIQLRVMKYNTNDDIILLSSDLQISIAQTDKKIAQLEAEYKDGLSKLNAYEESLGSKKTEINDILKHQGLIEVRDSITLDLMTAKQAIDEKEALEKELKKKIREYNDRKKEINQRYYELMLADKIQFGLEEIDAKDFEKITNSFVAGGSNKPISTVIWYTNLIKLKNQFNPDAINFPVVFDSPNNAETDKTKRVRVYEYLAKNIDDKNQLILSGIGINSDDFDGVQFDKVIYLDNAKYELLCEEDYKNNIKILIELSKTSD
jgi:hypothetical protein